MEQVTQSINPSTLRDYEKDPIEIKNYAYLLNTFSPFLIFFVFFALLVIWKYVKLMALGESNPNITFYIAVVVIGIFINSTIKSVKGFAKASPIFTITNKTISFDNFIEDYKYRFSVVHPIQSIKHVQYILAVDSTHQFGKINNTTLLKRIFKTDIGDMIIELITYLLSLFDAIVYMPIKIFILLKHRETLTLLFKNFLIEFDDGTAMLINIYSQEHFDFIRSILKENHIDINDNLKLSVYLSQK